MSSPFPAEIVDQIIDHLHAHPKVLGACALVSRAWLGSSRFHGFMSIVLKSKNIHAFFELTDSSCCTIIPQIRHLSLVEGGNDPGDKNWLDENAVRIPSFDLDSMSFINVNWDTLSTGAEAALLSFFPKLKSLRFLECYFSSFTHLAKLVTACPMLETIRLPLATFESIPGCISGEFPVPPSSLSTLEVCAGAIEPLLNWLLSCTHVPPLETVEFGWIEKGSQMHMIKELAKAVGSSLKHIKLGIALEVRDRDLFHDSVDFSYNDQIQSIDFVGIPIFQIFLRFSYVRWIPQVFSRLGSWCLETISFEFYCNEPDELSAIEWDTLDRTFSKPQFARLRRICIQLNVPVGQAEASIDWLRARLPSCEARCILHFPYPRDSSLTEHVEN